MRTLAVLLACSTACTSATLHRWKAPSLEAEISDADQDFVYISDHRGQLYRVPRAEVSHVDHPGNWLVVAGALVTLMGVAILTGDKRDDVSQDEYENGKKAAWAVFVAPGVAMIGWGGFVWGRSVLRERRRGPVVEGKLPAVLAPDVVLPAGAPVPTPAPPPVVVPTLPVVP